MDFSPADSSLSAALARALGHPPPFSESECATLEGPLTLQHASDLSELRHCTRLRHLEIFASDVQDLSPLADLKALRHLTVVATPLEALAPLRALPDLEHLTLNFTHVRDVSPLVAMPALRRLELQGNPLTEESHELLTTQLSSAPAPKTGSPPRLLMPSREGWEITRQLWERGMTAGLARIDFRSWFLVRAGVPRLTPGPCDAVIQMPLLVKQALAGNPSLTLDGLFQQSTQHLAEPPRTEGAQLRSRRPWGSSTEAASWVHASTLDEATKAELLQFIAHFPTLTFYRETPEFRAEVEAASKVQLPAWLRELRQTLAWLVPDQEEREVMVRFRHFDFPKNTTTEAGSRWYSIVPGRYSGKEQRRRLEQMHLMNVGISDDSLWSQLLIRVDTQEDRSIYDFAEEMFRDLQAEGRDTSGTLGRVFSSYTSMLAAIDAVRVRQEEPILAVQTTGTPS